MTKQFKPMKVLCAALLGTMVAGMASSPVFAAETPENVVEAYVRSMNEQSWSAFSDLHAAEKKESLQQFFANPENEAEHTGVLNVTAADLTELVEIDLADAEDMLYEEYDPEASKVYVFGVDYDVHEDTKYYSSGVNYNFITLVNEEGEWKVREMLPIAEPEQLTASGYEFSDAYDTAVQVMEARQNGYFLNYEGEMFATLDEEAGITPYAVLNKRTVPTSSTTVRYKASNGTIKKLKFHDYCIGVVAGESRQKNMDGAVRQAQAIATKTFTWHFIIVPHGASEGYDVNSKQQNYYPEKVSENSKVTTDYNAVKKVWMESNGGAIFEASYSKGSYGDQSKLKNGGVFKQEGARWLKDNNKATTYKALLKYYYDSSNASTGGAIRFFDDNKNEL